MNRFQIILGPFGEPLGAGAHQIAAQSVVGHDID